MKKTSQSDGPLVAVVSHLWMGHIPGYHRLIVERAHKLGWRVVSITPDGRELPGAAKSYRYHLGEIDPGLGDQGARVRTKGGLVARLRAMLFPRGLGISTARRARRNWRSLARVLREAEQDEHRPLDFAFIVYLGYNFLEVGVSPGFLERILPCAWGGIWNGPTPGRNNQSPLVARLWSCEAPLRARNCRTVWVPHRRLVERFQSFNLKTRVMAMPEIADLRPAAVDCAAVQRLLAAAAGRRITGLLGCISLRKGIMTLIEAAQIAVRDAPELFFIAAGEFSRGLCGDDYDGIAAVAARAPANFLFLPGRIPEGPEFNAHVVALDVLYAVYRDFPFQSNLLTKAAHFRKPVLVASGEVMASCTSEFDLGGVVPADDPQAVLNGIRSVLGGCRPDGQRLRPRFEEFSAMNEVSLLDDLLVATVGKERV